MTQQLNTLLNRRHFLKASVWATAGGVLAGCTRRPAQAYTAPPPVSGNDAAGALTLPDLPYAYDALEPTIDARTMEIHHSRHHAAYTNNVTRTLEAHPNLAAQPLESLLVDIPALPADLQATVRNNGGGHWNHELFWDSMHPDGGGQPGGELGRQLEATFGDFESFQSQFNQAALTQFGSGWAWLIVTADDQLAVTATPKQDNPLMHGLVPKTGRPILGIDVWEHAYYLNYQNRRGDYVEAWWDVVNWPHVAELYAAARALKA